MKMQMEISVPAAVLPAPSHSSTPPSSVRSLFFSCSAFSEFSPTFIALLLTPFNLHTLYIFTVTLHSSAYNTMASLSLVHSSPSLMFIPMLHLWRKCIFFLVLLSFPKQPPHSNLSPRVHGKRAAQPEFPSAAGGQPPDGCDHTAHS